ncbi:MAG: Peptide chain release factor 2 [Candidatus Giovannonibacteria bacterium GW2011_GWA2_53_7]|uniref:Peptide chain release factor 2 n=1 Tax=Candidatus Giovannonibacteria bacterium GW2011_GWA2_53_7 TaxID=1618650 RepID=A0A0G1Y111_9BACT|nr:MAG: Peptide chain release factor 2 [Candidatus Giovannonibacteria bacterium GW2011_GWA2_53_7]
MLEAHMIEPGFWNDQERARTVSQEASDLKKEVLEMEEIEKKLRDLKDYLELAEAEGEEAEGSAELQTLTKRLDGIELRTLFSGEHDKRDAILEIHAGSGGTEANDWTAILLRMYLRFCEGKEWNVTVLFESRGEEAGYKSVGLRVKGRYAYGMLKAEAGVHRLVRISPFDAEKMRHTTFALVDVVPEFDDVEVDLDMNDVRVETSTSQGAGGQSLKSRLYQLELERREKDMHSIRGDMASAEWGNQIRSYVLHPYKMVKDHRTLAETQDAERVLNGDLDLFIDAYLRQEAQK